MNSNENMYYSNEELKMLGVLSCGEDVHVSRKTSIYSGGVTIGNHVRIDDFCVLIGNITIGNYIHIGSHCGLHASKNGKIIFEDYTGISSNVQIYANTDDFSGEYMTWKPGIDESMCNCTSSEVILCRFSQIGTSSVLLPGGKLNEGAAVGAMSLVISPLDSWSIYAGIPCKKIKDRKKAFLSKIKPGIQ